MCGIIGVAIRNETKIVETLTAIYENQKYRGQQGAGFGVRKADGSMFRCRCRSPGKALRFLANRQSLEPGDLLIFHHRYPTSTPNYPAFNHPIANEDGSMYLIHNGHISNDAELLSKLGNEHQFETLLGEEASKRKFITDSEVIIHLLEDEMGSQGLEEGFRAMAKRVRGSLAIAVMSKSWDKLMLFKNGNPLEVFKDPQGNVWFSSVMPSQGFERITSLSDGELGSFGVEGYECVADFEELKVKTTQAVYYCDEIDLSNWMPKGRRYCSVCGEETAGNHKYCEWCYGNIKGK